MTRIAGILAAVLTPVMLFALPLVFSTSVRASSVQYPVLGGTADISVYVGSELRGSVNGIALTGNSVTIDAAIQEIQALDIVLEPNVHLSLSSPYGGYDEIIIESAALTSSISFATISSTITSPSTFGATAGPLTVTGTWGGTGSQPAISGVPIQYTVDTVTGYVGTSPFLNMAGVTLDFLPGGDYGETEDLTILASFQVLSIPEPNTAVLLGLGLSALAAVRRARRAS